MFHQAGRWLTLPQHKAILVLMLPPFDENGNLPPGVYLATLAEIETRFATTPHRKKLFIGLIAVAENLKAANCKTLYLNGSFITNKEEPGDYDACWEPLDVDQNLDPVLLKDRTARKTKYLGDIYPRIPELAQGLDHFKSWQLDRDDNVKGIIVIDLREPL